jgi:hypothetical protein
MALRSRASRRSFAGFTAALALVATVSGCTPLPGQEPTLPAGQLKKELLTPPTGSTPFSRGTAAPGGILNIDQFVDADFITADRVSEKETLGEEGFRNAVETNWHAPDGTQADLFMIQFGDSAGAEDYVSGVAEATSSDREPAEALAAVPGVSGGESWTAGAVGSAGDIEQIAWLAVGNVAVDLHYYTPAAPDPTGLARLAQAQRARLARKVTTPSPVPVTSGIAAPTDGQSTATDTQQDRNRLLHDLVPLPGGAHPWGSSASNGATGIINLQQLLVRFTDGTAAENARATAQQNDRGFQYAVREDWVAKDDTEASITLLQFATVTGAQSFTLSYQSGAENATGRSAVFPIPGDGTGKGYEHPKLNSNGDSWTEAYAVVGNIAVDVDFWRTAKPDRAAVIALVQQQLKALEADATVRSAWVGAPALPTADS